MLPGLEPDKKLIWTYFEAMVPERMPKSLLVIGSGAIGIEFASFYRTLGAEVTVVEVLPQILPVEDAEIATFARKSFEKQGIKIMTGAKVTKLDKKADSVTATIDDGKGGTQTLTVERVISAVGVVGNIENLGLEKLGVKTERGAVDDDGAPLGLHAELFQSEILDIADHAHRGNHPVDGERLRAALAFVDGRGDAVGLLVELRHLGAGHDLDALPLEALAREGRDLGVLRRQDLRQHLDHGHFGAERAIERRELDADRARADHQQRFRHAVRHHRLEIGPDQLLVGLEPGQHPRPRAGRDDDVLGLISARSERALRRFAACRPSP